MRKTSLGAILIAAVAAGSVVRAQSDFNADRFKAHVTFLADDVLEGREAGTRGHEIAARYIASQFALLGVRPGATGAGYFERVNLQEARLTGPSPTLTLTGPRGTQTLKQREAVMIEGSIAGGPVKLNAPEARSPASFSRVHPARRRCRTASRSCGRDSRNSRPACSGPASRTGQP